VDDDNWVARDWVDTVHRLFSAMPHAAAIGGSGDPVIESGIEPGWFKEFSSAYAVGSQYDSAGDITDLPTSLLWGAGLCIRRRVIRALLDAGFEFSCTEKLGRKLYALVRSRPCEDIELCLAIRAIGGRLFYVHDLTYKHFMPSGRLTWPALRKTFFAVGRSSVFVQNLRAATNDSLGSRRTSLERHWLFHVARTLRSFARLAWREPISLVTRAEGSLARLQADGLVGQLDMLFRLRSKYGVVFDANRVRYRHLQDCRQALVTNAG
jgi:hypothetical protein